MTANSIKLKIMREREKSLEKIIAISGSQPATQKYLEELDQLRLRIYNLAKYRR